MVVIFGVHFQEIHDASKLNQDYSLQLLPPVLPQERFSLCPVPLLGLR